MRAFNELMKMKISRISEDGLAAKTNDKDNFEQGKVRRNDPPSKCATPSPLKEDETALHHTSQLQTLIRRSRAPAVVTYLAKNSLSPDFIFQPQSSQANHHSPTPLHLSASTNSHAVVLALLVKAGADPTVLNNDGKVAFDLAGDRSTRDAFRIARSELGESKWRWEKAHCPPAMTRAEATLREELGRLEFKKSETARREADINRLNHEPQVTGSSSKSGSKVVGIPEQTTADRREQEARGLTPEMKTKLERERRARAAEERIKRMAQA